MKLLRILLLILAFVLHHTVAAAQSVHTCCLDADCPVTACAQMGCLPAAVPPLATAPAQAVLAPAPGPSAALPMLPARYSDPFDGIWRPPD